MKSPSLLKVLFLCVLLRQTLASVVIFQRADDNFVQERNSSAAFISCNYETPDDDSSVELLPADISDIGDVLDDSNSIINVYKFPESERGKVNFDHCAICSYHSIKCADNVFLNGEFVCFRRSIYKGQQGHGVCEKHIMKIKGYLKKFVKRSSDREIKTEDREMSLGNQLKSPLEDDFEDIIIPIGKSSKRSLQTRSTGYCAVPSSLTTAEVSCRVYPSRVVCIQRCGFGYTLDNGIQEKLQCLTIEGEWKPGKFKECKPFVDCNLSLSSGGSVACSTKDVFRGPECTVSCLPYEDKEEVEAQNYTCDIEGKWDPPLPFCVTPGTGLQLTKAPMTKLHEDV